jgi:prolyl-tRNA synthetase
LERYYKEVFEAYTKICRRCGFSFRAVEATTGAIGGSFSHEFMVLAETGEEEIAWCECGYGANIEKAECQLGDIQAPQGQRESLKEVHSPDMRSVEEVGKFLKASPEQFIKTLIYLADGKPVVALVRGDYEINEAKLQSLTQSAELVLADPETIVKVTGAPVGFAGPVQLKENVPVYADYSVATITNAITGANKKDYHLMNVVLGRDYTPTANVDIRNVRRGDICRHCGKPLQFSRGIEVGHVFKLGLKYSKSMNASYLDESGKENLMVMGCYGIGVSRILAATIEQSHDENGIIWPEPLAPFKVVVVPVNFSEEKTRSVSLDIYQQLVAAGVEVLIDDRDERAGIKFKDADLIGIPYRITVGEKNLKNNNVELKARWEQPNQASFVPVDQIVTRVKALIDKN